MNNSRFILSNVLGVIIIVFYILAEKKASFPLVKDYKTAFITMAVSGFIMCTVYKAVQPGGWSSPFAIAGILLGILAFALILITLFRGTSAHGKDILSFLNYASALRILFIIIIIKWGITVIHHFTVK